MISVPHTFENIKSLVEDTLANEFELEKSKITGEARLREDLGLDSLDGVDMIVALEKALKIQIAESDARAMKTVDDVIAFIQKAVETPQEVPAPATVAVA